MKNKTFTRTFKGLGQGCTSVLLNIFIRKRITIAKYAKTITMATKSAKKLFRLLLNPPFLRIIHPLFFFFSRDKFFLGALKKEYRSR